MIFMFTILPVFPVHAASKITLKSGAAALSTIYVGKSYTLKVAGSTVKFTSSKKNIATIGLTTGKLKAKDKKSGKTIATKTSLSYKEQPPFLQM